MPKLFHRIHFPIIERSQKIVITGSADNVIIVSLNEKPFNFNMQQFLEERFEEG